MRKELALAGLLVLALGAAQAAPMSGQVANYVDGPHLYSDSNVDYIPYEQMEKNLKALAEKFPERAKLIHYGKTPGGRNMNLLRIEDSTVGGSESKRMAVEISGAIHGNEFLGIEDKLAETFLEKAESMPGLSLYLATGGVIYVIPVINPDGYARRVRGNSKGVDLNRDFDVLPTGTHKFKQPETAALRDYIEQDLAAERLQLKFAMDYHCCVPALITPWSYKDAQPRQEDLAAFNELVEIQRRTLGYMAGNSTDTVGYLANGTSVDYFYAKHGTWAFTIEGKWGGEMGKYAQHVKYFDEVFQKLAMKQLGLE